MPDDHYGMIIRLAHAEGFGQIVPLLPELWKWLLSHLSRSSLYCPQGKNVNEYKIESLTSIYANPGCS
jgi:hypothetical protein